jgi:hypothetical protein
MSSRPTNGDDDLIEASLAVIRRGRERAPRDFLVALALALVGLTAVLLVAAFVTDGYLRDLSLNFAAEAFGAVLTVVVIDGVWKRREAATTSRLDSIARDLGRRRGGALTTAERDSWQAFVEEYEAATRSESVIVRLRDYPRRIRNLEEGADRAMGESDRR